MRSLLRAPEVIVATWRAARRAGSDIPEDEVRQALEQLDPLWDELFPAEQARIVQLLVERVDVGPDGADDARVLASLGFHVFSIFTSPTHHSRLTCSPLVSSAFFRAANDADGFLFTTFSLDEQVLVALLRKHSIRTDRRIVVFHDVITGLDVHIIKDNYATHKTAVIKSWLARRPHYHVHFTPTSASWINQVERWFAELTRKQLRRVVHT